MLDSKYVMLILNCYKYKSKAEHQKNTWLKTLNDDITYFHIIGDSNITLNNKYMIDHSNNIIYTNTKDDYVSLPHKVIVALEAINENYNYKYIFKTDDDQMLKNDKFFNIISKLLSAKEYNYGGRVLSVPDHNSNYHVIHDELPKKLFLKGTTYCTGRFYILSKLSVDYLITQKSKIIKHIIEDHAIGLYLSDKLKGLTLNIMTDNFFIDSN